MCIALDEYGPFVEHDIEATLYQPLMNYLYGAFLTTVAPSRGIRRIFAADTSTIPAGEGGMWTRPDVSAALVSRHQFSGTVQIDLYTFEVKRKSAADLGAVYETLAHTRFSHLSYLVWNCPRDNRDSPQYHVISESCQSYGIGLITVHDPDQAHTYDIELRPERRDPDGNVIDEFIASRFLQPDQDRISGALRELQA